MTYFVRAGDFVKIGTTVSLKYRLKDLRAAVTLPLELLGTLPGDHERTWHATWAADRQPWSDVECPDWIKRPRAAGPREWFTATPALLAAINLALGKCSGIEGKDNDMLKGKFCGPNSKKGAAAGLTDWGVAIEQKYLAKFEGDSLVGQEVLIEKESDGEEKTVKITELLLEDKYGVVCAIEGAYTPRFKGRKTTNGATESETPF